MPTNEQIYELRTRLTQMIIENWRGENFLTWQWWLLLAILVIPWVIWWAVVDKRRTYQLLTFGFMVSIVTSLIDVVGLELGLYLYQVKLVPFAPRLLPYVLGMLPVIYMLLYQRFPRWRPFTVALLAASAALAFIFQPIMKAIGMYELIRWSYVYSFLIYVSVGLVLKWVTEKFPGSEAAIEKIEERPFLHIQQPAATKPLIKDEDDHE
ncbi:MAG: hypothetical protein HPY50_03835 [Firmicutes bacterium]|nr:hypothetical protein [Bacillota bacterium]